MLIDIPDTADKIVALINSRPASPTKAEIEALLLGCADAYKDQMDRLFAGIEAQLPPPAGQPWFTLSPLAEAMSCDPTSSS